MPAMPPTVVVSDASVVLKWFHATGEEEVGPARALLDAYADERIALVVLDLTSYEVGNALLRGSAAARPESVATVLDALADLCPHVVLDAPERRVAANLASEHRLTFYEAAYAAVARARGALLATVDRALVAAGLGLRPAAVLERVETGQTRGTDPPSG
jgi:predicted nucleic acid-binding protein